LVSACGGDDGSVPPDARIDASDAASDAAIDAVVCTAEPLEPNDSALDAFPTALATNRPQLTFPGVVICPAGDKDFFQVQLSQPGLDLEVLIKTEGASPVEGAIIDSTGTTIATSVPTSVDVARAYAPDLPAGDYYAEAFAADASAYRITFSLSGF
jgi:hypothetical protein